MTRQHWLLVGGAVAAIAVIAWWRTRYPASLTTPAGAGQVPELPAGWSSLAALPGGVNLIQDAQGSEYLWRPSGGQVVPNTPIDPWALYRGAIGQASDAGQVTTATPQGMAAAGWSSLTTLQEGWYLLGRGPELALYNPSDQRAIVAPSTASAAWQGAVAGAIAVSRYLDRAPAPSQVTAIEPAQLVADVGSMSPSSASIASVAGQGIPTEGLTTSGVLSLVSSTVQQSMSLIGLGMTFAGAPVALAGKAVQYGLSFINGLVGRGARGSAPAEEGSPAAQALSARGAAEASFAAENPLTAQVLSFFGIHAVAQPTAEELAAAAESAHFASVASSLGITGPGQGFAYSGSPTGFVDVTGQTLEFETGTGNLGNAPTNPADTAAAAAAAAADAAAAAATADAAAGTGVSSGGAAGEGAPSDGGDGGDGGDGE